MRREYNILKCATCGGHWVVCAADLARMDFLYCTFCGNPEHVTVKGEYDDMRKCMTEPPK